MSQNFKTYFNWSSGKDSALALFYLQKEKKYNIDRLLTSINTHNNRVSMHGLREELLYIQAKSINLPVSIVSLPEKPTMKDYNHIMTMTIKDLKLAGYSFCGFGDIFLEDLRTYKENLLKPYGITSIFPIWKINTKEIIYEFIELGFKAVVNCVNGSFLDKSFVGREIDKKFINDLPSNVDVCGENGEFHTFCYDGPIFSNPIKFKFGKIVYREYQAPKQELKNKIGFWFCDLIPIKNK